MDFSLIGGLVIVGGMMVEKWYLPGALPTELSPLGYGKCRFYGTLLHIVHRIVKNKPGLETEWSGWNKEV